MLNTDLNEMIRQHIERKKKREQGISKEDHTTEDRAIIDKDDEEPKPSRSVSAQETSVPDDENAERKLINKIIAAHKRRHLSFLHYYYEIGRLINDHFKREYGEETLKRISARTGVGLNTLSKACLFSRKYSRVDYTVLFGGNFDLTWYQIAQNLKVEPDLLIETYRRCKSRAEFDENIVQMKGIGRNGGQ